MTAEQLEELLGKVTAPITDWDAYYDAENKLEILAPSLARRVIAAERLVEALGHVLEDLNQNDTPTRDDVRGLNDAFWAYREASK